MKILGLSIWDDGDREVDDLDEWARENADAIADALDERKGLQKHEPVPRDRRRTVSSEATGLLVGTEVALGFDFTDAAGQEVQEVVALDHWARPDFGRKGWAYGDELAPPCPGTFDHRHRPTGPHPDSIPKTTKLVKDADGRMVEREVPVDVPESNLPPPPPDLPPPPKAHRVVREAPGLLVGMEVTVTATGEDAAGNVVHEVAVLSHRKRPTSTVAHAYPDEIDPDAPVTGDRSARPSRSETGQWVGFRPNRSPR